MKFLKIAGIVILSILVVIFVIVLFQPAQGHVERSIAINVRPQLLYYHLNSYQSFQQWSPWAKMDPQAKFLLEGPASGVGAKMSWEGKEIGKGSQTITESEKNKRIKSSLIFEGYDGKSNAEFIITPEGEGSRLLWTYDGDNTGVAGKAMWVVMKPMLGGQYEEGLTDLKKWIESQPELPEVEKSNAPAN